MPDLSGKKGEKKEETGGATTENECFLNEKQSCFMSIIQPFALSFKNNPVAFIERILAYMLHPSRVAVSAELMSPLGCLRVETELLRQQKYAALLS